MDYVRRYVFPATTTWEHNWYGWQLQIVLSFFLAPNLLIHACPVDNPRMWVKQCHKPAMWERFTPIYTT